MLVVLFYSFFIWELRDWNRHSKMAESVTENSGLISGMFTGCLGYRSFLCIETIWICFRFTTHERLNGAWRGQRSAGSQSGLYSGRQQADRWRDGLGGGMRVLCIWSMHVIQSLYYMYTRCTFCVNVVYTLCTGTVPVRHLYFICTPQVVCMYVMCSVHVIYM